MALAFEPVADNYGECDENLVPEEDTHVAVEPSSVNADDIQLLQNTINPLNTYANHGIDPFEETLIALEDM